MSDFDEKDIVAPSNDFDEADLAPNLVEARDPASDEDAVGNATRSLMGGGIGAGAGYVADKALGGIGNFAMRNIGDLSQEDMDKISSNRDIYKNVSPLETKLEEFRTLAEGNRQGGIKSAEQAREALKGQAPIPTEDFFKTLAGPAENPKYSTQLAPDKAHQLLGDELDRAYPTLEDKQSAISNLDNKISATQAELANPSPNQIQLINQEAKDRKFQNKMGQMEPKLGVDGKNVDTVDGANDTYKAKTDERKILRLDEKIAKTEAKAAEKPAALEKLEDLQKKKEDFLYNQKNAQIKSGTVRDVRNQKQFDAAQNRKTQLELNRITEQEFQAKKEFVAQQKKAEKLQSDLEKYNEQKNKITQKIDRTVNKAASKADANLQNIKQAPAEIRQASPFLENRILGDNYADALENAIKDVRHSDTIDPVRVDQKLQEIRDFVPDGKMATDGKFNAELSSAVRQDLHGRYPEYASGMNDAEKSFKTEALFDKLGIKYNKDLDRTTLEQSGANKLNHILLNPEKYPQEYAYLQEALDDSEKNGTLLGKPADLLREAEVSALKGDVGRLRNNKELNAFDINSMAKGDVSRTPGILSKLGGTRLQELHALYKDSTAAKVARGVGKTALIGAGGILGGMAAANAAENGEISPTQATSATLAEGVNPIPLTDSVESIKAGNTAYNDSVNQGDHEAIAAAKGIGGATAGFFKPATDLLSNVVPAADSALEDAYHGLRNGLEKFGNEQSHSARSIMDQNMKDKAVPVHEDFKNFVEQKPEHVQNLLAHFQNDPSAKAFVAPLEKAAQSDDRTRSAVLFGLYQQPAFRLALKNKK
jgi:hypothetical protein